MKKVLLSEKQVEAVVTAAKSINEAVDMLLGGNKVSAGSKVAVIHDETYPFDGVEGVVKGPSAKGSGFVDVSFPNGTTVPLQVSLLIPV